MPAGDPRAAAAPGPIGLDVDVVGAGRTLTSAEFHAETATTSLLVLVDGELRHEWYADGLGPGTCSSARRPPSRCWRTWSGSPCRSGALELDARRREPRAGAGRHRLRRGAPVRDLLTMTSGVDWVEDHRDPDGPATALRGGVRRRVVARGAGRRRAAVPAGHPLRVLHGRFAGARLGAGTRHRSPFPRGPGPSCGETWGAPQTPWSRSTATASRWPAAGWPPPPRTGPGSGRCRSTAAPDGERLLDRSWVDDASRPSCAVSCAPDGCPRSLSAHVGFGYHWWPLDDDGHRVSADGSRGQFVYVDRPRRVVVVKTSDWAVRRSAHDRHCRDLSYLTLAADRGRGPSRRGRRR